MSTSVGRILLVALWAFGASACVTSGVGSGSSRDYSGRVVANLLGPAGQHMRCHFQLVRPASGMSGGGQGQCQIPSNKTIEATFARS